MEIEVIVRQEIRVQTNTKMSEILFVFVGRDGRKIIHHSPESARTFVDNLRRDLEKAIKILEGEK